MTTRIVPASTSLRLHHGLRQPLSEKLQREDLQLSRYVNELIRRDLEASGQLLLEKRP